MNLRVLASLMLLCTVSIQAELTREELQRTGVIIAYAAGAYGYRCTNLGYQMQESKELVTVEENGRCLVNRDLIDKLLVDPLEIARLYRHFAEKTALFGHNSRMVLILTATFAATFDVIFLCRGYLNMRWWWTMAAAWLGYFITAVFTTAVAEVKLACRVYSSLYVNAQHEALRAIRQKLEAQNSERTTEQALFEFTKNPDIEKLARHFSVKIKLAILKLWFL